MAPELENYWFARKGGRCNIAPVAWQGWLMVAAYSGIVSAAALLVERSLIAFIATLVLATGLLFFAIAHKTRGGLCARRGGQD